MPLSGGLRITFSDKLVEDQAKLRMFNISRSRNRDGMVLGKQVGVEQILSHHCEYQLKIALLVTNTRIMLAALLI